MMNENTKKYYFSIIKLCCIIILITYFVYSSKKSLHDISVEWFLLAIILAAALGYELINKSEESSEPESRLSVLRCNKSKFIFLCVEAIFIMCLLLFFKESKNGLYLLPIVILDCIMFFDISFSFGLLSFFGVFLKPENIFLYLAYCFFVNIIYFQNYIVIEKYKKHLDDFEQEEYRLKDSIHTQGTLYKEELEKSSLAYENKILEEKARLSQALHDKLGHSINGSIYQLEASKVLMEQQPEESRRIVQGVIDNLRTSMDEIRSILRRDKPDKKRMALLQLIGLCEECKAKYGIWAEIKIDGEDRIIAESIWEVILDNTFEAVTNALKYSKCSKIIIEITILHKLVRCNISDNGIGCNSFKEGMGIQGMMNRTRKLNGFIDINTNEGFRINMIIPLVEN